MSDNDDFQRPLKRFRKAVTSKDKLISYLMLFLKQQVKKQQLGIQDISRLEERTKEKVTRIGANFAGYGTQVCRIWVT